MGGIEKYKQVLRELFYQLKDHPVASNTWLAGLQPVSVEVEPDEAGLL